MDWLNPTDWQDPTDWQNPTDWQDPIVIDQVQYALSITACDLKQDQALVQLSIVVVNDIICKCYQ